MKADPLILRKGRSLIVLLMTLVVVLSSCSSWQAVVDRSAMEKIFWPGPPEEPRITYLWSLSTLAGEGEVSRFFSGGEIDFTDPTDSPVLLRPYGLFSDGSGSLFVTDPGAYRITVLHIESGAVRNIKRAGDEDFLSPIGIAADGERVYVSDSLLKKVFILDKAGKKVGEMQGDFLRPTSLAIDKAGKILYISDTLADSVYAYTLDGKRVRTIGRSGSEAGEFNFPTHLWVDRNRRLYVTDSMNFRVQVFSPEGVFERAFGTLGDTYGNLEKPKGVATDSDGNVYVVDSVNDSVKIFNGDGKLLLFFGEQGREFGQFSLPSGIFIDEQDRIYVADTLNGRVQVLQYLKRRK